MLPARGAVTYNAPSGPTVLPRDSSSPVISNVFPAAATCTGAPPRLSEADSLATGAIGDAGSPHAARVLAKVLTIRDANVMRFRIVEHLARAAGMCKETSGVVGEESATDAAPPLERPLLAECGIGAKSPSRAPTVGA
jgi:hypothetical protein